MKPAEIVKAVHSIGGRIWPNRDKLKLEVPKGRLTLELREELKAHKPELIEFLELAESCRRIEEMELAIRIGGKNGEQGWWLVASTARSAVDDDAPVYLATECLGIITSGLSHGEIRTLDQGVRQWKEVFGGVIEHVQPDNEQGREE